MSRSRYSNRAVTTLIEQSQFNVIITILLIFDLVHFTIKQVLSQDRLTNLYMHCKHALHSLNVIKNALKFKPRKSNG